MRPSQRQSGRRVNRPNDTCICTMVRAVWCVLRVYVARCMLYVAWHMLHRRAYCSAFVRHWPKSVEKPTQTSTLRLGVAPGVSTAFFAASHSGGAMRRILTWSHAQYRTVPHSTIAPHSTAFVTEKQFHGAHTELWSELIGVVSNAKVPNVNSESPNTICVGTPRQPTAGHSAAT